MRTKLRNFFSCRHNLAPISRFFRQEVPANLATISVPKIAGGGKRRASRL